MSVRTLATLGFFACSLALSSACSSSDETYDATASLENVDITPSGHATRLRAYRHRGGGGGGETTTPPPTPPPPTPSPAGPMPYRGVNLAGAQFGSALPGTDGTDYTFPTNAEIDHFVARGMNTFRIGFMWERLQPSAYGEFASPYFTKLDALVAHATAAGAYTILSPHNYARYYDTPIGSADVPNAVFADFWRRVALKYAGNPHVMFNLVNEPHDIGSEQWVSAANAAIAAIRDAGATNVIIAPGNAWTGAWSWNDDWYGTPNATAMLAITDPQNNTLYEVHQYLDASSQGEGGVCISTTIGRERLQPFVDWLRAHGKRGFLGEFAGGDNATCNVAIPDMLAYMNANADVLDGWAWWAAGPWWGNYEIGLEPQNGVDRPQMALLLPFLAR